MISTMKALDAARVYAADKAITDYERKARRMKRLQTKKLEDHRKEVMFVFRLNSCGECSVMMLFKLAAFQKPRYYLFTPRYLCLLVFKLNERFLRSRLFR
ncbi:hypothetical protein J6590_012791 [Homalodisca vitripennis]|nr:hypothetical protein J6590_012791 [Homalodisca vitripennis]